MGLTVSRQTAENFTANRQKKQLLLAVKRFQGLSNVTILAGMRALKESFFN